MFDIKQPRDQEFDSYYNANKRDVVLPHLCMLGAFARELLTWRIEKL